MTPLRAARFGGRVLISCFGAFLFAILLTSHSSAQITATPSDEEVRRIVEKAMAAVALAEAQATRDVAEVRIMLIARDSEISELRSRLASEREERIRLQEEIDSLAIVLAQEREIANRNRDSVVLVTNQFQKEAIENEELHGLLEELQTRASLLEESLRAESARAGSQASEQSRELSLRIAELEREIAGLRAAKAEADRNWTMLENSFAVASEDLRKAEAAREALHQRAQGLADRLAMAEYERTNFQDSLIKVTEELKRSEDNWKAWREAEPGFRATIGSLEEKVHELEGMLARERTASEELIKGLSRANADRDSALEANARLAAGPSVDPGRVAVLEEEIAALRQILAGARIEPEPVVVVPVVPPPVVTASPRMLNFNTASEEDLAAVPAIGPTRARTIIWYRDNVGSINSEEDLKSVPGFNDERISSIKMYFSEVVK